MDNKRRKYSKEFKQEAVRLVAVTSCVSRSTSETVRNALESALTSSSLRFCITCAAASFPRLSSVEHY